MKKAILLVLGLASVASVWGADAPAPSRVSFVSSRGRATLSFSDDILLLRVSLNSGRVRVRNGFATVDKAYRLLNDEGLWFTTKETLQYVANSFVVYTTGECNWAYGFPVPEGAVELNPMNALEYAREIAASP